jgi:hypothetical protein
METVDEKSIRNVIEALVMHGATETQRKPSPSL